MGFVDADFYVNWEHDQYSSIRSISTSLSHLTAEQKRLLEANEWYKENNINHVLLLVDSRKMNRKTQSQVQEEQNRLQQER